MTFSTDELAMQGKWQPNLCANTEVKIFEESLDSLQ